MRPPQSGFVQVDRGDPDRENQKEGLGQAQWCRWWFQQVHALEIVNGKQLPYPYIELNESLDATLIRTDEGVNVFPPGSIKCWQIENYYAP